MEAAMEGAMGAVVEGYHWTSLHSRIETIGKRQMVINHLAKKNCQRRRIDIQR